MSRKSLEKKIKLLKSELSNTYVDSRKAELKSEISHVREQIRAGEKALEELQEELPW